MSVIEWEDELRAFADNAKKELQHINDVELLNKLRGEIFGKIRYLETCISRAKEHSGIDVEVAIQSYKNRYDSLKEQYDIRENECHDLRTQISELKNKLIPLQNEKNIVKKTKRRQSKDKLDSAAKKPKILVGGLTPILVKILQPEKYHLRNQRVKNDVTCPHAVTNCRRSFC